MGERWGAAEGCRGDDTVWSLSESTWPATELWSSTELPANTEAEMSPASACRKGLDMPRVTISIKHNTAYTRNHVPKKVSVVKEDCLV